MDAVHRSTDQHLAARVEFGQTRPSPGLCGTEELLFKSCYLLRAASGAGSPVSGRGGCKAGVIISCGLQHPEHAQQQEHQWWGHQWWGHCPACFVAASAAGGVPSRSFTSRQHPVAPTGVSPTHHAERVDVCMLSSRHVCKCPWYPDLFSI